MKLPSTQLKNKKLTSLLLLANTDYQEHYGEMSLNKIQRRNRESSRKR